MIRSKYIWIIELALLLLLSCLFLYWMKGCERRQINGIAKETGISIDKQIIESYKPTVIFKPTYKQPLLETSSKGSRKEIIHSSNGSEDRLRLSELPTRANNTNWNATTGELSFKWYGFSFGPGVSIQTNGKGRGLGIDIRGLYINDFGLQFGVGIYKNEPATPQISLGYNLRKTRVFSNVDLIIGLDLKKTVFGGLRVELGSYWRK